jgi:hypothetical protein
VVVYVLASDATSLSDGLDYMATQVIDYLVGPPDITTAMATEITTWVAGQRADGYIPKAVLPDTDATARRSSTSRRAVSSWIVRLIRRLSIAPELPAFLPDAMTISCTYAPLPEVSDVTSLTKEEMDTAIDAGEFILFNDGEKVKVGRGLNSLQTTTQDKGSV